MIRALRETEFAETKIGGILATIGEEAIPYQTVVIALFPINQIFSYCSEYLNREIKLPFIEKLEERKYPKFD